MGYFVQTSVTPPSAVQRKDGDFLIQGYGRGMAADAFVQLDDGSDTGEEPPKEGKAGDEAPASVSAGTTNNSESAGAATAEQEEGEGPTLQQKSDGSGESGRFGLSSYLNQTSADGSKLDATTNQRMSGAFGFDFSNVQLHTDSSAANVCKSLGANAFATGNHVYFGEGKYNPGSASGDRLLAHELTHVVQASGGVVGRGVAKSGVTMGSPGDAYEVEADNVASAVVSALHGGSQGQQVAKDDDGSTRGAPLPTMSLAQAIIQRKISGVPDVQMDIGVTLGVAGLAVGIVGVAVSTGAWVHSTGGSNTLQVSPNVNWIGSRTEERNRYRASHPWRTARMNVIPRITLRSGEYYGCNLTWRYNGGEIIDVRLDNYYWQMIGTSSHTHARIFDDQSETGKLGVRASGDWDPWGFGDYETGEGSGWISVDGSGSFSRPSWS